MLKQEFSDLQTRIGEKLRFLPIHPNHITLFSILLSVIGSYLIINLKTEGLIYLAFAFLCDILDGAIARSKKLKSNFGAYLDGISDRLVEFFALFPFFFHEQAIFQAVLVLFFGTSMTSFSKAYASHRGITTSEKSAKITTLFPRAERVITILIALVLLLNNENLSFVFLWVPAFLSIVSFFYIQLRIFERKY